MLHIKPFVVMAAALGLFACTKTDSPDFASPQTLAAANKSWDETAEAVAKDVSQKLNSIHFRKMLKREVLKRFDGDANVLLSSMIKRLPKYVKEEASQNIATRTTASSTLLANQNFDVIAAAAKAFPQMQIAVQTHAENWDADTFTPSVVYETADYDEPTSLTVPGFDPAQRPIAVDAKNDPAVNYVVVSQNERTTMRNGELQMTSSNCEGGGDGDNPDDNPNDEEEVEPTDPGCGGGGGTPPHPQYNGTGHDGVLPTLISVQTGTDVSPPPYGVFNKSIPTNSSADISARTAQLPPIGTFNGTPIYRANYRHEKIREILCDHLGQIESWFHGAPEIRMHVFEQNVQNPSETFQIFKEQFLPDKRGDIDGKWWNAEGVTMHLWDYSGTGTRAAFGYYEFDPGISLETLESLGSIIVDLLALTQIDSLTVPNQVTIYGNIARSVATGVRGLRMRSVNNDYIGKDDYSIFNNQDEFNHSPGGTKFKTWPDL